MTIYVFDAETPLTDSQVPDSEEVSSVEDASSTEIYEPESGYTESDLTESEPDRAVTETTSSASVSYPDYSEQLELIEADTRVILYVLLLFLVILFLWLTYKLYNTIMN